MDTPIQSAFDRLNASIAEVDRELTALEQAHARIAEATKRLRAREVEAGAAAYRREYDLPKLHPGLQFSEPKLIITTLERLLRKAERSVAMGHWAADQNRVIALRQALAAERAIARKEAA